MQYIFMYAIGRFQCLSKGSS